MSDKENPEWTEQDFKKARPARKALPPAFFKAMQEGRVGRPKSKHPKQKVTIRLDEEVLQWLKSSGTGWQTRLNDLLTEHMHSDR